MSTETSIVEDTTRVRDTGTEEMTGPTGTEVRRTGRWTGPRSTAGNPSPDQDTDAEMTPDLRDTTTEDNNYFFHFSDLNVRCNTIIKLRIMSLS